MSLKNLVQRKIINDPKLQYGIVGFFVGLASLNFIFVIVVLKLFEGKIIAGIQNLEGQNKLFMTQAIETLMPIVYRSIFVFGGFMMVFAFLCGLLILQHISGPIFVIRRYLEEMIEGKVTRYPVKLRKYDFYVDIAEKLNKLYEKYDFKEKNK